VRADPKDLAEAECACPRESADLAEDMAAATGTTGTQTGIAARRAPCVVGSLGKSAGGLQARAGARSGAVRVFPGEEAADRALRPGVCCHLSGVPNLPGLSRRSVGSIPGGAGTLLLLTDSPNASSAAAASSGAASY